MQIYISQDAIVASVQRAFRAVYPYLTLEFYRQPRETSHVAPAARKVSPETPVDNICMADHFGWIDISRNRTALELEYDFRHILGLHAQVVPRPGDRWLQTACTENWSLAQLNAATIRTNHYLY